MVLDGVLRREMLKRMEEVYPEGWDVFPFRQEHRLSEGDLVATLVYLQEHGLVDVGIERRVQPAMLVNPPAITAKGLDFLAADGGLTAELGVVTIKIHDDTLRQLLARRIDLMLGTDAEKAPLRQALKDLPATAGKALLDKLVTLGVENLPSTAEALGHWIRTLTT